MRSSTSRALLTSAGSGMYLCNRAVNSVRGVSPAIMQATLPPRWRPEHHAAYLANVLTLRPSPAGHSEARQDYGGPLILLDPLAARGSPGLCTALSPPAPHRERLAGGVRIDATGP